MVVKDELKKEIVVTVPSLNKMSFSANDKRIANYKFAEAMYAV